MLTEQPTWILMPIMVGEAMTEAAISDCLAQSIPVRVLLILQGIDPAWRTRLEQIAESEPRLLLWSHDPPLPSLSATWNRALRFVWEVGGTEALVVNNDVRLHQVTVGMLKMNMARIEALFVTAVGVTDEQYSKWQAEGDSIFSSTETTSGVPANSKGGPDFSCFLISKAGHEKYPFDESFTPAFCEDLDSHRRFMLGGDGDKIFSINLPFLHLSSQTIKSLDKEKQAKLHRAIEQGSRAYYLKKWGGPVNDERWTIPFDASTDQDGVTTPDLQRLVQGGQEVLTLHGALMPLDQHNP